MLRRKGPFCLRQKAGLPLRLPPPKRSWKGASRATSSVQSRAPWDGARRQRPHSELCPPHRCLASRRQRQLPRYETGPSLHETAPFFLFADHVWLAGLRGRAPFSCGKKRALPLKLPLPPKTAHGKARSTRLPLFRQKNKEGKRQQRCRPKGGRHTALQQTTGGDSAVHPGNRQAPSTIDGRTSRLITGTTFSEGKERSLAWR